MNNKKIEEFAVLKLKDLLLKNPFLSSYIDTNDKTPLEDGLIHVHNSRNHENDNIEARVMVQVKGTTQKKYIDENQFRFEKSLIKYFYNYGGILFVVFINEFPTDFNIYYKSLTPAICKAILDRMKSNDTILLKVNKFPEDINEQVKILLAIDYDSKNQYPTIINSNFYIKDIDFKKNKNFKVNVPLTKKEHNTFNMFKELSKSRNSLYIKPQGHLIYHSIEPTKDRKIIINNDYKIIIENTIYFYDANLVFHEGEEYIKITDSMYIPLSQNTFNINLSNDSIIREKEIRFLVKACESGHFYIDNDKHEFILHSEKNLLCSMKEELSLLELINNTLKKYDIHIGICFKSLTQYDINKLKYLYSNKIPIDYTSLKNNSSKIYTLQTVYIQNIKIAVLIYSSTNKKFLNIENINNDNISYSYKDHILSKYLLLDKKSLYADNLNLNILLEDFERTYSLLDSNKAKNIYNAFLLNLIDNYDKNKNKFIGQLMLNLGKIIQNDDIFYKLNYLQIKKRLNLLTQSDEYYLESLITLNKNNLEILFAVYTILNRKEEAQKCFSSFNDDTQNAYHNLPIFTLYKEL